MRYEYKIIYESTEKNLETMLNILGKDGWRLINVVWDYDNSLFIAVVVKN